MDLNQALEKHAEWKVKFRVAIAKKESLDATTIARDNCCDLGKWLHTDAKQKHGHLRSYAQCLLKHASFHAEAARIARTINARQFEQAEAMLGSGSGYAHASTEIGVAINHLKKELSA